MSAPVPPYEIVAAIFAEASKRWPQQSFRQLTDIARQAGLARIDTFSIALGNTRDRKYKRETARFLNRSPQELWPDIAWQDNLDPLYRQKTNARHCQKRAAV